MPLPAPLKSPLRYPGGKAFLAPYVEKILCYNSVHPDVFVESFAGGASVSLHLLGKDLANNIALFDLDPLVSGFWWTVFFQRARLTKQIQDCDVNLETWNTIRDRRNNGHCTNAWKCLFLNRTNYSGILTSSAGPIGGQSQKSSYKINCRFYKDTLLNRLEELWQIRDRVIEVATKDWEQVVDEYEQIEGTVFYFDPPFFHKADRLYNCYFTEKDHERFVERVREIESPWILSYDHCEEAVRMFRKYKLKYRSLPVSYTASTSKMNQKKELISSNLALPRMNHK